MTTATREAAPAGFSYRVILDARIGTAGCGERATQALGVLGAAATLTFVPGSAAKPAGGAAAWCTGQWIAALVLIPDSGSTGAKTVAAVPFTVAP